MPATLWVIWYCPLLIKLGKVPSRGESRSFHFLFGVQLHFLWCSCFWIMKRPSYKPVTRADVTVHVIFFPREHLESEAASHTRHFHRPGLDSLGLLQDLLGNLFLPSVFQPNPSSAQFIWADWLWVSQVGYIAVKVDDEWRNVTNI